MKKEKSDMGAVFAEIELVNSVDEANAANRKLPKSKVRRINLQMLVDTGSTMMILPEPVIKALGLKLTRTGTSRMADGRVVARKVYGPVKVRFQLRTMQTEAVAGSPGVPPLLGQIPLEALDLLVDSKNQKLILNPQSPDPAMAMFDLY